MTENEHIPKWKLMSLAAMDSIGLLQGNIQEPKITDRPIPEYHSTLEQTIESVSEPVEGSLSTEEKRQQDIQDAHKQSMEEADAFAFAKEQEHEKIENEIKADTGSDIKNYADQYDETIEPEDLPAEPAKEIGPNHNDEDIEKY